VERLDSFGFGKHLLIFFFEKMEVCLTGSTPFEGHFSHPHVLASRPSLASLYGTHQGSSRRLPFRIPSALFEELDRTGAKPPRIVINVSGRVFEAPLPMFSRHPETLLGNPLKRIKFYDPHREEYFFSRDQQCAEAIVEYYQSGKLRRPQKIGLDLFLREVSFFEISVQAILRLCDEEGHQRMQPQHPPKHPACFRLWEFAMDPHSSRWALLYATTSLLMVLLSIVVFCLETVPMFHEKQHLAHSSLVPDLNDTMSHYSEKLEEESTQASRYGRFLEPIFLIESVCVAWFSMEFLLHFTVCPDKKRFIGSPLNIIDLLAIVST
jgi:potassium voltage-gated channel Shaker-related subfamily A member 2